jgi:hypothetical protein
MALGGELAFAAALATTLITMCVACEFTDR